MSAERGRGFEREALFAEIDRLRDQLAETRGASETVQITRKREALSTGAETSARIDEQAFLRSVLEATRDCVQVLDVDARLMLMSSGGGCALEIRDFKDIAGLRWPELWPEPVRGKAEEAVERARNGDIGRFLGFRSSPEGATRWWDVQVTPIRGGGGGVIQLLAISRDVSDQQAHVHELAERDALHRAMLDSSTDFAIISMDRDGKVMSWNVGAQQITQWTAAEMVGRPAHIIFTPEQVAQRRPEKEMREALETGKGDDEGWHLRRDGTRFWANGVVMPLKTEDGRHIGFLKVLRDRTDRKDLEDQQQLLMEELNHRVKNTLAVVQAVVSQTLRTAASPDEARQAVMQRLGVIGRAQDLLTRTSWTAAPVADVVEAATAPMAQERNRLHTHGPEVEIGPRAVMSLTMALHELGTNAFKYGAFSNDAGQVNIHWSVDDGEQGATFSLTWRERGGPPVIAPTHRGFGSRLIEFGLARGLGGAVELKFEPDGVCWSVSAPLAAVQGG